MFHRGTVFSSDKEVMQSVLKRQVEQSGKFPPDSTAESVAAVLADEITSKTIIITGVSPSGLGAEAARVIFKHNPKLLILASRSKKAIDDTIVAIGGSSASKNVRAVEFDLSDFKSVRKAAEEILETAPAVDVLINNAGIMMLPEFKTTKQGNEMQFGVNHLGHFLFTNLLIPSLLQSPAGCVVNISSAGHRVSGVHLEDVNFSNGKTYEPFIAYGQSKSSNILFSVSLTHKLGKKGLRSFAVDPGAINTTGLNLGIPMEKKIEMGWWDTDGTPSANIPVHSRGGSIILYCRSF
ncbi:NAD(P)-binding protein [Lindgomyces ingoldianus]|uniref:NAD(P)-binding protein n=1 Tax=Lindgomyces ingoldianus TaxID=673940 RepID=A0ACB6QXV7_9PLEO|nr:NAD(P)-binding protein [Lindgomyces ingoldianus]KAF2471823.1 NAD(P)-binding protein [Lindgomyces ingoldianus]